MVRGGGNAEGGRGRGGQGRGGNAGGPGSGGNAGGQGRGGGAAVDGGRTGNQRPGADKWAMPNRSRGGRGGAKISNPHGADLTKERRK